MSQPLPVTDQIVLLLRTEGPMTMSKISAMLGRNPGGIRQRLIRMAATGRVIASIGPAGWTIYTAPSQSPRVWNRNT